MNTIANINLDMAQSVFSGIYLKRFNSIRNSRFTWLHSQYKYIRLWLVCILNVIPNLSSRSLTKKNYFHTVIKSEYFPTEVYLDFYFTGYVNERIYKFCVIIYTIVVKLIQFRFVVVIYIHSYVRLFAIQVLLSYLQVHLDLQNSRAAVHLNFRAGSTFPVPVCTVSSSMDRNTQCNKVDAFKLYALYRLNLLLPKGQICVQCTT